MWVEPSMSVNSIVTVPLGSPTIPPSVCRLDRPSPRNPGARPCGGCDTGDMDVEPVLRAAGLVKQYKRVRAVDGISLVVGRGERVALLGPNGAGKTTTLLMLLGVITPDAGEVEIAGHRLPKHRSQAAEHVGFAAGYLPLPERMRVREFLRMFGQLYGIADPTSEVELG